MAFRKLVLPKDANSGLTDQVSGNNFVITMKTLRTRLRKIGNSTGVVIPKALLELAGLEGEVDLNVEDGALIIRRPARKTRDGWAGAAAAIAASGDDSPVLEGFGNNEDSELTW